MSVLNDRQDPAIANMKTVSGKMSCCRFSRPEKCVCNTVRATTDKMVSKLSAAAAVADIFSCGTCSDTDKSMIASAVRVVRKTSDKNPRPYNKIRDCRTMRSCHDILTTLVCVQNLHESRFLRSNCVQFKEEGQIQWLILEPGSEILNHSSYEPIITLAGCVSRGYVRLSS